MTIKTSLPVMFIKKISVSINKPTQIQFTNNALISNQKNTIKNILFVHSWIRLEYKKLTLK